MNFSNLVRTMLLVVIVSATVGCRNKDVELDDSAEHFIAAQQALAAGDTDKAMAELDASIAARPDQWAYFQRAKLRADAGDEQGAKADCQAGLKISPKNTDLKWLDAELRKPAGKRFKGKHAKPPSSSK